VRRLLLSLLGCCALAAAQPTVQDFDREYKAFANAPSLERFVAVGKAARALMTPEQARREDETGKPHRPLHKRFEEAKQRLAAGIGVKDPVRSRPWWSDDELVDPLKKAMTRAQLPTVRQSFFGNPEPFVVPLRPFTLADQFVSLVDALSAFNRTAFRVKVLGPAKPGTHGIYGVYDVGQIGITFAQPVRIHGLAASGAATGADITSLRADFTTNCGEKGLNTISVTGIDSGWRGAVVAWLGKAPPGTANMSTRQISGADQYEKLVIDTIDIDRDGVSDFSVWSGIAEAVASIDTFWKAVFGNVNGQWVLLAFAQEADCT
jgi:hypothetical protein